MKKIFHKTASFCLAFLVLLSTMSFTVDSHFCGDMLVDSSFFGHVETCGMEMQQQKPFSSTCDISNKDCCSDEQLIVDGQDTYKTSFDNLQNDQQIFIAALVFTTFHLFVEPKVELDSYRDYAPPLIVRDIHIIDQTFLI